MKQAALKGLVTGLVLSSWLFGILFGCRAAIWLHWTLHPEVYLHL